MKTHKMLKRSAVAVVMLAALVVAGVGPAPVEARTFPGENGKIAFTSQRDGRSDIWVMESDGANPTNLTNHTANDAQPAWSPDGTKIAFTTTRDSQAVTNDEIYVMEPDGSNQTRLTNHTARDVQPAWSPDGSQIAFTSTRDGRSDIWVMESDGANPTNLTNHTANDADPAWSPDGSRIAFASRRDGNDQIYVMEPDGSNQTRLTNHTARDVQPVWSPDGSQIAFTSTRDGNDEIYVMEPDGSNQTRLTNNVFSDGEPSWSPDGAMIAFTFNEFDNFEIYVMESDGSNRTQLTDNPHTDRHPDWQPIPVASDDVTPPVVECEEPAPVFVLNESPAEVSATVSDDESGPKQSPVSVEADTSSVGAKTVSLTGEDNAGNSTTVSCSYQVTYDFEGFFAPVNNQPELNEVKAGRAVPLKWRLLDANGDPVTDLASVHVEVAHLDCDATQTVDALEEHFAGTSGLQNLGDGFYQWNWASPKSYAGSCKTLQLDLGEGHTHNADFSFVK